MWKLVYHKHYNVVVKNRCPNRFNHMNGWGQFAFSNICQVDIMYMLVQGKGSGYACLGMSSLGGTRSKKMNILYI